MDEPHTPGAGDRLELGPAANYRAPAAPFSPYPADQLEKEQAVLDLTDAAQADTRAAAALERGDLTESRRLSG